MKGPIKIHLSKGKYSKRKIKKKGSKTSQEKKNVVILGDSIPKEINTRLLNKKLIKSKVVCKFFPGVTSKDIVHYIKPILQEDEFDTSILHIGVNDVLKLGSNIDIVSKDIKFANHCKNFGVKQISCFTFGTCYTVKCKFYLPT